MKKVLSFILTLMMAASVVVSYGSTSAVAGDPADSYVVQRAANEDSDIQMWFQHANVKVHQEDTASSGRNTYSIYMAKNEYQGTQVTLYSPSVTKSLISAEVGDFTAMNGSGATMAADLYYEFYIECTNLDTTDVLGVTDPSKSFIREGMIPDAMEKIENINRRYGRGKFTLTAGKTQTLFIKVKSELDTPSGWYSAQFNVLDSSGNVIKTATVYAYVWNFEIPEATHLQTAVNISRTNVESDTMYKNYYDYLLDNRLCAFEVPGYLNETNEYLANPRVNAIAVSNRTYKNQMTTNEIRDVYNKISSRDDWEDIKGKFYFYTADEPRSQQQKDYIMEQVEAAGITNYVFPQPVLSEVFAKNSAVARGWPDPYCLVAIDDNQPYPPGYDKNAAYDSATGTYLKYDDKSGKFDNLSDAIQGMMDDGSVNIWCMKTQVFTPSSVLKAAGYTGMYYRQAKVMHLNGPTSGFDCINYNALYFDWDTKYGPFAERFKNFQSQKAANGEDYKLWVYECGKGPDYTYCNHLIENTGLQTSILFWQTMQNGATGYLYYGANLWNEHKDTCGANGSSASYDGSTVSGKWNVNRWIPTGATEGYPGAPAEAIGTYGYGNGVLLYGKSVRSYLNLGNSTEALGTIRVEQIRDGIEDYEMLYQYREIYGESAMQALISKVSTNVVNYLSMPSFNRSSYSSSLTDEDIFANVRIELGNAVESAQAAHTVHTWDEGVVTKEPTYAEAGEKTYTCTVCGETYTEEIARLTPVTGDIDGDGIITAQDIKQMKAIIAGVETAADWQMEACDFDLDNYISASDLKTLKSLIAS